MKRRASALCALTLVLGTASTSFAHAKIDEARARVEAAEFDAALRLLAEAESGSDLARADAMSLLELRALVHLALHDADRAEETLRMLAVLAPERVFASGTSPDLVHAFARARASAPPPPRIALESMLKSDGVHLRGHVEGDALRLVHGLRLWTRVGDAPWRSTLADETIVVAPPGQSVEYRAMAEGIGGAPILATGVEALRVPREPADKASHVSPWLYAGLIGATLAVAATIVAVVLSNRNSDRTQPSPPQVVAR